MYVFCIHRPRTQSSIYIKKILDVGMYIDTYLYMHTYIYQAMQLRVHMQILQTTSTLKVCQKYAAAITDDLNIAADLVTCETQM